MLPDSLKSPLLNLYYVASLPQRRQTAERMEQECSAPVMTLFYHRVADEHPNGWTISNDRFQEQINWIRERYAIVSLSDAQQRIGTEHNLEPVVCLTFDDGYADNCEIALPWLVEEQIPFTYFVTTNHIASGEPFAHDLQAGTPLKPNSIEQIQELSAAGVEIGAHTRSHADLGQIENEQELYEEIVGSKRDLEAMIDRPVNYFAFPFGLPQNMSTAGMRIAYQAGFWGVCSAYGGYNLPGDDNFHIQRIHGDPEWSRFRNWLTLDPRKLRQSARFDLGDYRDQF